MASTLLIFGLKMAIAVLFRLKFRLPIACLLLSSATQAQLQPGPHRDTIDGLALAYRVAGQGPVMLVGHPNSGKIGYERTLRPLETRFTMVYYDPRGTGGSEAPATLSGYGMPSWVAEIEALRKRLGVGKIWLFGHSDQSGIAMAYARLYPEKVEGLILSGTGWVGTQEATYERRRLSETRRRAESAWFDQVVRDWEYMIRNNTARDAGGRDLSDAPIQWWCYDEASSQKVIPIAREIGKAGRRKPVGGAFYTETEAERKWYLDLQDTFGQLRARVLILNGRHDTNNPPEDAAKLAQAIPGSKLVLIEKAGHFPWLEAPDAAFGAIGNWLGKP